MKANFPEEMEEIQDLFRALIVRGKRDVSKLFVVEHMYIICSLVCGLPTVQYIYCSMYCTKNMYSQGHYLLVYYSK